MTQPNRHTTRPERLVACAAILVSSSCGLLVDPGPHHLKAEQGGSSGSPKPTTAGSSGGGNASSGGAASPTDEGGSPSTGGSPVERGGETSSQGGTPSQGGTSSPHGEGGTPSQGGAAAGSSARGGGAGAGGREIRGGTDSGGAGGASEPRCEPTAGTGATPRVIASGQYRPTSVKIDSTYVYWIEEAIGDHPAAIMRAERHGTELTVLTTQFAQPKALALRVVQDKTRVLFTNDLPNAPGVYQIANETPGTVIALDTDDLGASLLSRRDQFVYTEAWSPGAPTRIRKSDASVKHAHGQCYPATLTHPGSRIAAIGADESYLYYTEQGYDIVYRTGIDCTDGSSPFIGGLPGVVAIFPGQLYSRVFFLTSNALLVAPKDDPGAITTYAIADGAEAMVMADPGMVYTNSGDGSIRLAGDNESRTIACGQVAPNSIAINERDDALAWTDRGSGQVLILEDW